MAITDLLTTLDPTVREQLERELRELQGRIYTAESIVDLAASTLDDIDSASAQMALREAQSILDDVAVGLCGLPRAAA